MQVAYRLRSGGALVSQLLGVQLSKAEKLTEKYRARAEAIADEVEPTELRELLYYLVDTVLERAEPESPEGLPQIVQLSLPLVHA